MTQVSSRLSDSFAVRLSLALKALNMSSAQLAATVGVNKSLVSRWLSGQMAPTGYNLARISSALAAVKPGFNMTLWERPRAEFELFLGLCTTAPVDDVGSCPEDVLPREAPDGPAEPDPSPISEGGVPWSGIRKSGAIAATAALLLVLVVAVGFALWRFWPLRHAGTAPAPAEASLAVLPFVNMSGDPKQDYFSDGFSEELRSELSNDPRLRVAARVSAFAFRGVNEDVKTIARTLRVGAIVEGTVREAGNRVRITAELVNASDGFRIWSTTYDRDLSDILNVQSDVARAVAAALTRRLLPSPPARRPRIDPRVYRDYLEARRLERWSYDSDYHAYLLLKSVTKRQPDFAKGWAALAEIEQVLAQLDVHSLSWYAMAGDSATRALLLDPHEYLARVVREICDLQMWNWSAASSDFRALQAENPGAHHGFRTRYIFMGFPAQAVAVDRHAFSKKTDSRFQLIVDLEYAGMYRELISTMRSARAEDAHEAYLLSLLCEAYAMTGQAAKAGEVMEMLVKPKAKLIDPGGDYNEGCEFYVDVARGDLEAARKLIKGSESKYDGGGAGTGMAYAVLKDFDKATDEFEQAYARRDVMLFFAAAWPPAADYRKSAGWKALTQRPLFKEWQAEHDRIAATLAAHGGDPLY